MQRLQIDGIYHHGGECVMQRRDFLKMALAGAASVPILGQGRRADAAPLITETFQGANTIVNGYNAAQSVTGFDNPASTRFTGWWHDSTSGNPVITTEFPCPVGSNKSLRMTCDTAHFDFGGLAARFPGIREFWYRIYWRFGDADSYSDAGNNVNWAKLMRVFSQTWQWDFIAAEMWNLQYCTVGLDEGANSQIECRHFPAFVPCKWFYHEFHLRCRTPGNSDGLVEVRTRNVSDNLPLKTWSFPNINFPASSTEYVDSVRIGGNTDRVGYPANEVIRYANFAFSNTGWIGEIGGVGSPPSPPSLRAP